MTWPTLSPNLNPCQSWDLASRIRFKLSRLLIADFALSKFNQILFIDRSADRGIKRSHFSHLLLQRSGYHPHHSPKQLVPYSRLRQTQNFDSVRETFDTG